jgi:hypothetical protein
VEESESTGDCIWKSSREEQSILVTIVQHGNLRQICRRFLRPKVQTRLLAFLEQSEVQASHKIYSRTCSAEFAARKPRSAGVRRVIPKTKH